MESEDKKLFREDITKLGYKQAINNLINNKVEAENIGDEMKALMWIMITKICNGLQNFIILLFFLKNFPGFTWYVWVIIVLCFVRGIGLFKNKNNSNYTKHLI